MTADVVYPQMTSAFVAGGAGRASIKILGTSIGGAAVDGVLGASMRMKGARGLLAIRMKVPLAMWVRRTMMKGTRGMLITRRTRRFTIK